MQNNCTRIDLVFDQYRLQLIKAGERQKRGESGSMEIKIHSQSTPVPKKWGKLISNPRNRENLSNFLSVSLSVCSMEKLQRGQQVVLAGCYKDGQKTELLRQGLRETVHSLVSDHKEADSRLLLHAKHASHTHARVIIQSPDTDVAILSVAHFQSLECQELWFHTGRPLNLEALKIWSWKPKNLEID